MNNNSIKKHSVFLINIPQECGWGGCEQMLLYYFREVDYSKNAITLVATKDIFTQKFEKECIPVKVLKFPFQLNDDGWKRRLKMFSFMMPLHARTMVFVHNGFLQFKFFDFLSGFILTRGNVFSVEVLGANKFIQKSSKKHFGFIPGLNLWWYKQILPITLRGWLSKNILAVSQEVKKRMIDWHFYPKNRIKVIHTGIDINKFFPDRQISVMMRKKFVIPEDNIVIISTARLSKQKCLHRAINAFDDLYRENKNCWLIFIGDGDLRGELENLAGQKSSRERIRFLGFKESCLDYLRMSDIYILPSDNEGLSGAMLEAMATGLISVITRAPGADEVVDDGVNGFLVERSEEGVREGLKRALSLSEEQKIEISDNAQKSIRNNFDLKRKTEESLNILGLFAKK